MGKKGTKRKTKWRALPLGEEAGGSGNEEDLLDEDQSTTSSIVGGQPTSNNVKRQSYYYKMADKSFRQTRRFTYDRFRSKEPLVKLESKTFDEEEYTKITTPRQDVLFKKGYFGRKRESSVEEAAPPAGEMDGEEPMMDQIIITNGFVDERGHYLVNGNSYEIYDPYSNTVTVVVGPPPYANGITQPVLAAVSCQPVPLQPVDWYPPAADWPTQGSAWTPSYPRTPHQDAAPGPGPGPGPGPAADAPPNFTAPDAQNPNLFNQPAYVVPGYGYGESPAFNGVPLQMNPPTEAQNSEENTLEVKKTRRKSTESVDGEKQPEPSIKPGGDVNPVVDTENQIITAQNISEIAAIPPSEPQTAEPAPGTPPEQPPLVQTEGKQVETQSHSTQTNLLEGNQQRPRANLPGKESHSTQTPPEDTPRNNRTDPKSPEKNNKNLSDIIFSSFAKPGGTDTNPAWKSQQGNRLVKKFREDSPRKTPHQQQQQQRTNYTEDRRTTVEKGDLSPTKVSYAKKAMSGLENTNPKVANGSPGRVVNGGFKNLTPLVNGLNQVLTTNGTNRANNAKQTPGYEEKRNGFVKNRYNRGKTTTTTTPNNYRAGQKYKNVTPFETPEKKSEETTTNESRSQSEKSSTVSELSSPTELSSGQNTPPEKLIVQKMEEEINKSFEEKLKQNLSKTEQEEEEEEEEEESKTETKPEEKRKGKKKKKGKVDKPKETGRVNNTTTTTTTSNKKKKKGAETDPKGKSESDNSSEEIPFLSGIREKELFLGGWEDLKVPEDTQLSFNQMLGTLLNGDKEILKSLGLNEDRISYSKLPLHSDLLMMLPTFGWTRPKLNIEDFFSPAPYQSDFFTKRNITNMKSTKPEEFFASVIDNPVTDKSEKKQQQQQQQQQQPPKKPNSKPEETKKTKTGYKIRETKDSPPGSEVEEEEKKPENEGKLGIVEAVNTWLQEQEDSEKFVPVDSLPEKEEDSVEEEEEEEEDKDQKNGASNPIHAPCHDEDTSTVSDFREGTACIRVANVINDGFIHVSREFRSRGEGGRGRREGGQKSRRMYRSSSWDAKLSEVNIRKHFKFLTDSASFCQDLISDVRNGFEYATEELCDPKQTVTKYYILAPDGRVRCESDSENEVFDALEYKFLTKETTEGEGKSPDGNGNASITDSGVHSDMESSEDNATEQQKETPCKLQ